MRLLFIMTWLFVLLGPTGPLLADDSDDDIYAEYDIILSEEPAVDTGAAIQTDPRSEFDEEETVTMTVTPTPSPKPKPSASAQPRAAAPVPQKVQKR